MIKLPLLLIFTVFCNSATIPDFMVISEKKITVEGNTSLGEFSCNYGIEGKNDTLYLHTPTKEHLYEFEIPTEDFQCGNFLLNRDYQKTLKAKKYPTITVKVEHLNMIDPNSMHGELTLTIAGKTQTIDAVRFDKFIEENKEMLQAAIHVNMSAFDLEPPKKLGGLIKTDDSMLVSVALVIN